jgi:hypothetical protein
VIITMAKYMQKVQATPEMVKMADEAYNAVQYACNGCGLAQSFAEVFRTLNGMPLGTDAVNQHPIIKLWIDKFQSLARIPQDMSDLGEGSTWDLVKRLAAGQDIEYEVIG